MIVIDNISKSYIRKDGSIKQLFNDFSMSFNKGGHYCIMGASGTGKTSLIRLISGLEKPDSGTISGIGSISMVFQDDRLIDSVNAVKNVSIACGISSEAAESELLALMDRDSLSIPCRNLSGGQRRRVCIVRAMARNSETVILDEPFTGLDSENRQKCIDYILNTLNGRTLISVTHNAEDAALMDAEIVNLNE